LRVAAPGLVCLAAALSAGSACAGAWTQPKGKGQVILKYENMLAKHGFDPAGHLLPLSVDRQDRSIGVFAEYGLTDRLTLQVKGDWQTGQDAFVDYQGRGPLEVGVTWQVWRDDANAVSLYVGYADGGEGRNAGYASPGVGDRDWEVRTSAGRSMAGGRAFVEVQGARRFREGLPDETRADLTVGAHFGQDWMLLGQAFGGVADNSGPRWLNLETSIVRRLGDWSLQVGWRQTVAGREAPKARGAILALWRRF
tara:strand:- start:1601 stop:2359 length:759 start_codon:yes stop_codon:yes gene_type:complete